MRILKTMGYAALAIAGGVIGGRWLAPAVEQVSPQASASTLGGSAPQTDRSPASAEEEISNLRARLAALERRLERPQGEVGKGDVALSPAPSEQLSPEQRSIRRLERFEERFQREPEDPPRDAEAAARVLETLAKSEATQDTHPIRVDCRSSMCRIEVEHDSQAAFDRFRDQLPELLGTGGTYVRLLEREPRFRSLAMHFDKSSG